MSRPTKETDAATFNTEGRSPEDVVSVAFAQNMERQRDELAEALRDLLFTSENADETGYVDGVGFIDIDVVREKAKAALATKEGGV